MSKTLSMKNTETNTITLNAIINIIVARSLHKIQDELISEIMLIVEEKKKSLKEIPAKIIKKIFYSDSPDKRIAKISKLTLLDLLVLAEILGVEINIRVGAK